MKKETNKTAISVLLILSVFSPAAGAVSFGKGLLSEPKEEGNISIPVDIDACLANFRDATLSDEASCSYALSQKLPQMVDNELSKEGRRLTQFEIIRIGARTFSFGVSGLFDFEGYSNQDKWQRLKEYQIIGVRAGVSNDSVSLTFISLSSSLGAPFPTPHMWAKKPAKEDLAGSVIKVQFRYSSQDAKEL
jgi:hypothetical protein